MGRPRNHLQQGGDGRIKLLSVTTKLQNYPTTHNTQHTFHSYHPSFPFPSLPNQKPQNNSMSSDSTADLISSALETSSDDVVDPVRHRPIPFFPESFPNIDADARDSDVEAPLAPKRFSSRQNKSGRTPLWLKDEVDFEATLKATRYACIDNTIGTVCVTCLQGVANDCFTNSFRNQTKIIIISILCLLSTSLLYVYCCASPLRYIRMRNGDVFNGLKDSFLILAFSQIFLKGPTSA